MLLAGRGFRDVCACRRPRGSSLERGWDGVPVGLTPIPRPGQTCWCPLVVAVERALSSCWCSLIKWVLSDLLAWV